MHQTSHSGTTRSTIRGMATSLRLRAEAEEALRDRAEQTGRAQQEIIREALDRYLGLRTSQAPVSDAGSLTSEGQLLPPRSPFREVAPAAMVKLSEGTTTEDLLDRDDRVQ